MRTQIKKWGDSSVLILPKEFLKFHDLNIGDWMDISDIVKIEKEGSRR